ncbi:hypothetical protein M408DRAFT_329162 [Serendipita vermifera MAFF 305830]|uniref:Uncharacterized protein n=1 Tax=Serendipita vermifera MAFF 305830 TaxID=933852 RepID=A0A0C3AVZ1_SERVB|nr:hypothetical protein M408DRAFT_329162 [Serendipita vermifera MAFF 305830]
MAKEKGPRRGTGSFSREVNKQAVLQTQRARPGSVLETVNLRKKQAKEKHERLIPKVV